MEVKQIKYYTAEEAYNALAPNRHKVFFGATGITTTEAAHKADVIKEHNQAIKVQFANTAAYHAIMDFKGKEVDVDLFIAIDLEGLATKEGEMFALSAWLREAVAAKIELINLFQSMESKSFIAEGKVPEFIELPPARPYTPTPKLINEKDALGDFSVSERAEYFTVEAKAAHLGQKIHPGKVIANIKRDLGNGKTTSYRTLPDGVGESTYLVDYEELYNLEEVTALLKRLQEEHRAYESKLNNYKARIKNKVTDTNAKLQQEYSNAVRVAQNEYQKLVAEYNKRAEAHNAEDESIESELEKVRLQTIQYVSALKVIIPKDLQHILDEIAAPTA